MGPASAALLVGLAIAVAVSGSTAGLLIVVVAARRRGLGGAGPPFKPGADRCRGRSPRQSRPLHQPAGRATGEPPGSASPRRREHAASRLELKPGEDLEQLVRGAVGEGADGLAMAGGDGSQALVAAIAAEHDLPYACIPSGTRNHFALDLGVDREDVVGALDALSTGASVM